MLRDDKALTFINSTLTTPDDPSKVGISLKRIADYRRLMSEIECGAITYTEPSALFVSDTIGAPDVLYFPRFAPREMHHVEDDWYWSPGHAL